MADEKTPQADEELRKLRARVAELEAENKRIKAAAPPTPAEEEELRKLRARVADLDAENKRIKAAAPPITPPLADEPVADDRRRSAVASIGQTKGEMIFRTARSLSLAWVEVFRSFADSFAAVGEDVLTSNHPAQDESVQSLNARLGSDVAGSIANVARSWSDIPARAADKFSSSYGEGHFRRRRGVRNEQP